MKFFHFADNSKEPPRDSESRDRLYKIRPLLELFSRTFSTAFTPEKDICLDESLLLYKGRIIFKQYIPLKRARYGIKLFCLSDKSGYLHTFRVYSGKDDPKFNLNDEVPPECEGMGTTAKTVISLLNAFLDKGYHLFVDNWYSSVPLCKYLLSRETLVTGTAHSDRVPQEIKALHVAKGSTGSLVNGQILVQKYEDKKTVYMLSTAHDLHIVHKERRHQNDKMLPSTVDDYTKSMGGVDRIDQLLEPYDATRKTVRWYVKLGIHFIQIALLNSYTLYRLKNKKKDFYQFSKTVASILIFGHADDSQTATDAPGPDTNRLTGRHFIQTIPKTKKERPTKRCRVCAKKGKRKESRYHCPTCSSSPGLCLENCFEIFHTKIDY